MNAGLPVKGRTLPGWGQGLTGVSHNGTSQNSAFVLASWLLGSPVTISRSTGVDGLPGHWIVRLCIISWGDGMFGLLVWTAVPVGGS